MVVICLIKRDGSEGTGVFGRWCGFRDWLVVWCFSDGLFFRISVFFSGVGGGGV